MCVTASKIAACNPLIHVKKKDIEMFFKIDTPQWLSVVCFMYSGKYFMEDQPKATFNFF